MDKFQVNYEIGQVPPSWPDNDVCKFQNIGSQWGVAKCDEAQAQ